MRDGCAHKEETSQGHFLGAQQVQRLSGLEVGSRGPAGTQWAELGTVPVTQGQPGWETGTRHPGRAGKSTARGPRRALNPRIDQWVRERPPPPGVSAKPTPVARAPSEPSMRGQCRPRSGPSSHLGPQIFTPVAAYLRDPSSGMAFGRAQPVIRTFVTSFLLRTRTGVGILPRCLFPPERSVVLCLRLQAVARLS